MNVIFFRALFGYDGHSNAVKVVMDRDNFWKKEEEEEERICTEAERVKQTHAKLELDEVREILWLFLLLFQWVSVINELFRL